MRKCPECSYLLLGDGENCNHCGAAVPVGVTAATVKSDVAPVWRPATPAAAPPPAPSWAAPARSPGRSEPPAPTQLWRPVEMPAPRSKTRSLPTRVLAIALGVVVSLVVGGFVRGMFAGGLPAGTSSYVGGHGVDYTAPDHSYLAKFPTQPVEQQQPVTVGEVTATVTSALVQTDDYEMGTASMQFPFAVPSEKVNDVLDGAMNGGIVKADGKLVAKNRVTRAGFAAVEATFKASDGYSAHALVMVHGPWLYMEFVHAKSGTDRIFKALDTSFVPVGS